MYDLANAPDQDVMKTWEGLGYYSRARNLHATAKYISKELNGVFPNTFVELLKLKGVGPYTAAAIASICFNEPVPVIDGNVFRFTARHFGIDKDISDTKNRKYFDDILKSLISEKLPGMFNQGMMEFGATVCKPGRPNCGECIFISSCYAYENEKQLQLPVKKSKVKVQERHIAYLIFDTGNATLMQKRTSSYWTDLFEFFRVESDLPISSQTIQSKIDTYPIKQVEVSDPVKHLLSHRKLWVTFYHIQVDANTLKVLQDDFNLTHFSWEEVLTLPRPKVIVNHLDAVKF